MLKQANATDTQKFPNLFPCKGQNFPTCEYLLLAPPSLLAAWILILLKGLKTLFLSLIFPQKLSFYDYWFPPDPVLVVPHPLRHPPSHVGEPLPGGPPHTLDPAADATEAGRGHLVDVAEAAGKGGKSLLKNSI